MISYLLGGDSRPTRDLRLVTSSGTGFITANHVDYVAGRVDIRETRPVSLERRGCNENSLRGATPGGWSLAISRKIGCSLRKSWNYSTMNVGLSTSGEHPPSQLCDIVRQPALAEPLSHVLLIRSHPGPHRMPCQRCVHARIHAPAKAQVWWNRVVCSMISLVSFTLAVNSIQM